MGREKEVGGRRSGQEVVDVEYGNHGESRVLYPSVVVSRVDHLSSSYL
jgi:hypothetical protein